MKEAKGVGRLAMRDITKYIGKLDQEVLFSGEVIQSTERWDVSSSQVFTKENKKLNKALDFLKGINMNRQNK